LGNNGIKCKNGQNENFFRIERWKRGTVGCDLSRCPIVYGGGGGGGALKDEISKMRGKLKEAEG